MKQLQVDKNLIEFTSVDQLFYYLENLFAEGVNEKHISMALDIFLRDAGMIEE